MALVITLWNIIGFLLFMIVRTLMILLLKNSKFQITKSSETPCGPSVVCVESHIKDMYHLESPPCMLEDKRKVHVSKGGYNCFLGGNELKKIYFKKTVMCHITGKKMKDLSDFVHGCCFVHISMLYYCPV